MTEPRRRRGSTKASFRDSAPSNNIPFPKRANMTVAEILAFFPNSIHCSDIVYRMISNGGTRKSVHTIINAHRDFDVEWSANCCGEAMYRTMEQAGYTDWTVKKHGLWHATRKASWAEEDLNVGDHRAAPNSPAGTVSFKRLAENVRMMPEEDDALDLTRMVKYCVETSGEGWRYPNDYEQLLDLLGGPLKAKKENTDGAVFARWEHRKPPPPKMKSPQGIKLFEGWNKGKRSKPRRQSDRKIRSRSVSPTDSLLGECRAARKKTQKTTEVAATVEVNGDSRSADEGDTPYARAPPEFVAPPFDAASTLDLPALTRVFQAEGFAGESDPYSAYAFGGPRRTPPYRHLHQISQPHPWDSSSWAEDLRWAFEQRVLFAEGHPEAIGWNESPEHMARIERERTQRVWASDELLDQLLESE